MAIVNTIFIYYIRQIRGANRYKFFQKYLHEKYISINIASRLKNNDDSFLAQPVRALDC